MAERPAAREGFRRALPHLIGRREQLGLSRRELALRLGDGIPDATIGRIERGVLRASPARQVALARELGQSVDDLFAPVEPPPLAARDAAIAEDFARLRSAYKVAEKYGLEKTAVYRALRRAGVATRDRRQERATRLEALAALEAEGVPRGELPERLGVSKTQLYRDLREAGYGYRRRRPDLTRALREAHAETQALVRARMDERGWVDVDGVAEILKLTRVGARGWLRARGVIPAGTVPAAEHVLGAAAGPTRTLYDPGEIAAAIRAWLDEFVDDVWRGDARLAARWYDHRFGTTVMHGRLASRLAAAKGKKVGKGRDKLTDEKEQRILKLSAERRADGRPRHSQQGIANIIGLSRSTVRYVQNRAITPPKSG